MTGPDLRTTAHRSGTGSSSPDLPSVPGYELQSELGRGGMGVVYLARQVGLNRLVALKMIRGSELAGADEIARFHAEAEAAARLQHPNIVQIHEIGQVAGQPHFSLEYVEGGTLRQFLAGNPQGPFEAAQLVETLARAVHVAHERGIVHRDLKPANILLARSGTPSDAKRTLTEHVPKITDFGLAKRLDSDITRTTTGAVVGTPAYMAPEQAAARARDVGPCSDVWALGAILYDVLTGRPPFKAATTRDTLEQVLHTEPVSPKRLQPSLPRDLETICLKCLQKEPRKRYASALELAEDLRRFLAGEPIAARPVSTLEQTWRFCLRKPYVAAVIVLGSCLAIGSPVVALVINNDRNQIALQKQKADEATEEALTKKEEAEAASKVAEDRKTQAVNATKVAEGEKTKAENARQVAEAKKTEALRSEAKAKASAVKEKKAHEETERALSDKNKALIESLVQLYHSRFALAERRWQDGDITEAQRLLNECPKEYRGFEWWYLQRLCKPELLELPGKGASQVTFTKSGRHLIVRTGLRDFNWPRNEKEPLKPLTTIWCWVTGKRIHQSPGSYPSYLLSENGRRLVYVKQKQNGKELFNPAGKLIVLDALQGTEEELTVPGEGHLAGLSDEGRFLAVGRWRTEKKGEGKKGDETKRSPYLEIFDVAAGKSLLKLENAIAPAQFSPDGKYVVAALPLPKVVGNVKGPPVDTAPVSERRVWELPSGKEVLALRVKGYGPGLQFSPGGKLLLVRQQSWKRVEGKFITEGETTLWSLGEKKKTFSDPRHTSLAEFSPDGRAVVVRPDGGSASPGVGARGPKPLSLFDSVTGKKRFEIASAPSVVRFSRDGKRLVCMGDKTVSAWDALTGKEAPATPGDQALIDNALFGAGAPLRVDGDLGKLWVSAGDRQLVSIPSGIELGRGGGGRGRVAVSPDGKLVAVASQRLDRGGAYRSLEVWEVATGKQLRQYKEPGAHYLCVAFSPDGARLAGAGNNNVIKLWDVRTGQEVVRLRGHMGLDIADPSPLPRGIERLTFSPDGLALISEGRGTVKVWDLVSPPGATRLETRGDIIFELNFNEEGNRLLVERSDDEKIRGGRFYRAYDMVSGTLLHEVQNPPWATAWFSPEGRWAITRTFPPAKQGKRPPATIQVRDVRTWEPHMEFTGSGTDWGPDDERVLIYKPPTDPKGEWEVKLWDLTTKKELFPLEGWRSPSGAAPYPFTPDNKTILYPRGNGEVALVSATDGKPLYTIKATLPGKLRYLFNPSSSTFVTLKGNSLELRDAKNGKVRLTLPFPEPLAVFDFWKEEKRLTALGQKGAVRVWDIESGKVLTALSAGPGNNVVLGQGTRLVQSKRTTRQAGGRSVGLLEVRCWDLKTGRETVTKIDHLQDFQGTPRFSPDGRRLACIRGATSAVEVWDLSSGQVLLTFPGTPMSFRRIVAFSPDSRRLLAGGSDLMWWDGAERTAGQDSARLESVAKFRVHAHFQETNRALAQGEKGVALFHIDRLLALEPANPPLRATRAGLQAERGTWDEAALDLGLALRGKSASPTLLPQYGLALYRSGELAAWKRLCENLVEKNSESKNLLLLDSVVRTCLLAPEALKDKDKLDKLVGKLAKGVPNRGYGVLISGMTWARIGEHKKALKALQEVAKGIGRNQERNQPEYLFFLAMAQHAEGQEKEARATLTKAKAYARVLKTTPEIPSLFVRPSWDVLARYDLLGAEVEGLLRPRKKE